MTAPGGRRPTMVDVARAAGVAHITVSRVVNNEPTVRPATRDRVLRAIDELGYRRNDSARVLRSGRSTMLGVVLAGSELFELPRMLLGIEQAAKDAGHWVSLTSWQGGTHEQFEQCLGQLVGQGAAGVAVVADRPVVLEALHRTVARVPISVMMSGNVANPAIGSVELDQVEGARLATRHLLDLGHRDVVHLSGAMETYDARARVDGWRDELRRAGIAERRVLHGDFTARSGHELAAGLVDGLADQPDATLPTAIFAGNDQMAIGVISALAARGIAVPGDVSLVGFDDTAGSDYLVPALTTVRQDFVTLGRLSIEVLLDMMAGGAARHHLLSPSLVVRASTRAV
ncbi:LacI family DNA-binding transcriptional regulator [Promicromonospora sp. NPDC060271]|uniref:LacI family DNA-binding transcriptional regulator n=1 Tax=Promicromonospora sp. NPDC060271 TaxID=3347089 RepID=UPI0036634AB8